MKPPASHPPQQILLQYFAADFPLDSQMFSYSIFDLKVGPNPFAPSFAIWFPNLPNEPPSFLGSDMAVGQQCGWGQRGRKCFNLESKKRTDSTLRKVCGWRPAGDAIIVQMPSVFRQRGNSEREGGKCAPSKRHVLKGVFFSTFLLHL